MDNIIKKPEWVFVIFALIFGLIMMFITPPYLVPDEKAHLLRACEVADGILYNKTVPESVECDNYIRKEMQLNRSKSNHQATGYSPLLYSFSALGLNAGKLFGGNIMFYLGRLFNLLTWIILTGLAIRITPIFKYMFLFAALLPMSIYEGMSYSADSFNNAFAFLFFAFLFKLIFEKKHVDKSDYIILVLMSLISAFTKGAIYPILLFFFLPIKKHKNLFAIICLSLAILLMSYWSSINFTFINSAADSQYHRHLLLVNPFDFLFKFAITIILNTNYYIRACIGILGLLNIKFYWFIYLITGIVFLSQFIVLPEKKITNNHRIFSLCVFSLFVVLMHIMLYITWTTISDNKITGIQGRYFISLLPYVFLVFAQSKKYFSIKIKNNYKIFLIIYIFMLLCYSCLVLGKHYL